MRLSCQSIFIIITNTIIRQTRFSERVLFKGRSNNDRPHKGLLGNQNRI